MSREWKGCVMKQRSMVAVELKTLHLYGLNNSFITDRHYNVIDVKKTKKTNQISTTVSALLSLYFKFKEINRC